MFDHEYFEVHPFENVPLNRDCYLMDECYIYEYEASMLGVFAGNESENIGYVSFVAARGINERSLDLSWYPNIFTRFHEVAISLPKEQFVTCVECWRYGETPHIFVKSDWLRQLHMRFYNVFCMVDAIGVKEALQSGTLSREKLVRLREAIDKLTQRNPEVGFVSFADSLLLKSNWTVGHFQSDASYTYSPEIFIETIKDIQAIYREVLDLDIYSILTQGTNEYYEDSLIHISDSRNHISLNSLGLPFSQLLAIDRSVRLVIKERIHIPWELYLDEHLYNSLRFTFEFANQSRPKYRYATPMMGTSGHYYCAQLQEILKNLQPETEGSN